MTKVSVFDLDYSITAERWAGFVKAVMQENVSIGALLHATRGVSWFEGVLTIEVIGSMPVTQMLKRPNAQKYLKHAAENYFTVPVTDIDVTYCDAVKE